MQPACTRLFLPGFGGRASTYAPGLPPGWEAVQPPSPRRCGGSLDGAADWLEGELARRPGPALLGGHSMGAALAVRVAARRPEAVSGLVLVAPAGLPLTKPVHHSVADLVANLAQGRHRLGDALASAVALAADPLATRRLVRELRGLDLRAEMDEVRARRIPVTVVSCASDTLTPPALGRVAAHRLGARHLELTLDGGHVWMFGRWPALAAILASASGVGVADLAGWGRLSRP